MTYSRSYIRKLKTYTKYGRITRINPKNRKANKFELSMYNILDNENIKYEREYQIPNTTKIYDVYLPDYHILIEFDGDYWHPLTLEECKTSMERKNYKNDRFKDRLALKYGFKLIRIRQSEQVKSIKNLL